MAIADTLDTDIPAVPQGGVVIPSGIATAPQYPVSGPNPWAQEQASEGQIQAAVGQLRRGQPVDALPIQEWSLQQAQQWNAKLNEFDRQAKAARMAAEQAARDAAMLDQMSRVAKSTKDIEIALRTQDEIGFRNCIARGGNAVQCLTQFPRSATSPLVSAVKAGITPAAPSKLELPGMPPAVLADGRPYWPPGAATPMAKPDLEDLGPGLTGVRVSPQRYQVIGKPEVRKEGDLTETQQAELTDIRREESEIHNQMQAAPRNFKVGSVAHTAATNRLAVLKAEKDAIKGLTPTNAAPAFDYIKNPKTGRWEKAKKP